MNFEIVPLTEEHRTTVISMMREFYSSPAVWSNGSDAVFEADVNACISDNPFLEGYVLLEDETVIGYGMLAKSFSTEFGTQCIWLEDLYIREACCCKGYGRQYLEFVRSKYPRAVLRLEAEKENERAVHLYKKYGYEIIPYMEMISKP